MSKISDYFKPKKNSFLRNLFVKDERDYKGTTGMGHNHEWDDMYHPDENGNQIKKEGWIYCWICGQETNKNPNK
jgi:hypothetical protein